MTFGGKGNFGAVGTTGLDGARRQIAMALDAGVNLIDTADVYSEGTAEEIVGQAIKGKPGTACCCPPRSGCRWAAGRTTPGCPGTTS